jgi:hypothetical protein
MRNLITTIPLLALLDSPVVIGQSIRSTGSSAVPEGPAIPSSLTPGTQSIGSGPVGHHQPRASDGPVRELKRSRPSARRTPQSIARSTIFAAAAKIAGAVQCLPRTLVHTTSNKRINQGSRSKIQMTVTETDADVANKSPRAATQMGPQVGLPLGSLTPRWTMRPPSTIAQITR